MRARTSGRHGTIATALALAALLLAPAGVAELLMSREQALAGAFPEADRVEKEILYLSREERRRIRELADAPMDSGLFTVYRGYRDGSLTGYAFIDTRVIRSKPAAFLVVLEPDGTLRESRILAWEEPPEYMPPERWLAQFRGRELAPQTRLGGDIQAMTGASLTSRSLTDGIRRVLAIRAVKLAGEG